MDDLLTSPPFGQADLTNCERELIHLAGSVQPHGALLVLRPSDLVVMQASANVDYILGVEHAALLEQPVHMLGGDIVPRLHELLETGDLSEPMPLRCRIGRGRKSRALEGIAHLPSSGGVVVELEPLSEASEGRRMQRQLAAAVRRFSEASTLETLADAVVQSFRDIVGYDRVMVYQFDPDGHGKVIAEAREAELESLLGQHYPASDIPQRARELYIRNRVRVLVDAGYVPVPIVPRHSPLTGDELDLSLSFLRSMSPLHTQYLKNMGVVATLVVSLVREGRLWGLIACHHYTPRNVTYAVRAAADVLAEVISTRIAAIDSYLQIQGEVLVRRLEQRLVEATSEEGDWRLALVGNPRTLLQPLDANGAALFYDGETLTVGDVPSTPELRALAAWVSAHRTEEVFECSSVARANPALRSTHLDRERRARGRALAHAARLPYVVSQGAVAHCGLGRRSDQAGHRQQSARIVAATLFFRVVGDRARNSQAMDKGGSRACAGNRHVTRRHRSSDPGGSTPDRAAPAR